MPLPRCRIPILTVVGLIEIAALQAGSLGPVRTWTNLFPRAHQVRTALSANAARHSCYLGSGLFQVNSYLSASANTRLRRSKDTPLARIDLIKGKSSDYRRTIGDVVYKAMVEILKAPENDRFQVINEHDADNFVYDPSFFGIERSADVVCVQLTMAEGRTIEKKRGFYKQVVDELNRRLNLRREDVFISLVGTGREDWSFGNGESSLIKS